jgi:hypothetical protein
MPMSNLSLKHPVIPRYVRQGDGVRPENYTVAGLTGSVIALAIIYAVIEVSEIATLLAPLVMICGAILLVTTWRDWEFGVKALAVVAVFEGAIRKWFLPAFSESVYFYKDILLVVIYISYFIRKNRVPLLINSELKLFSWPLFAFVLYAFASVMNSRSPHPLVGLFGVKAYCLYIPLAYLLPRMFTSREKLETFLSWYLTLALPVAVLGVLQFLNPDPNSSINRYAWSEAQFQQALGGNLDVAGFVDSTGAFFVRITSTFSFITGLGVFLPFMFAWMLSFISLSSTKQLIMQLRWVYYALISSVVAVALMTGSRSPVIAICFIGLLFYSLTSLRSLIRRIPQIAVIGVLIWMLLTFYLPQALDAFYTRSFGGEAQIKEGRGRIAQVMSLPIDEGLYAGPFGYGIGATQNSVPALMSKLQLPFLGEHIEYPGGAEGELSRVMLELGVVGYLLYMALRYSLVILVWSIYKKIQDPESKVLGAGLIASLILPLIFGGAIIVHTQNVYQWFVVGMLWSLLNAERLTYKRAPQYIPSYAT